MKTFVKSNIALVALIILVASSVLVAGEKKHSAKEDIVTTAVKAGNFTTLAAALKAADLVSALQGKGPFTVFAPTDEAFAKLPEGTVEGLLKDKEALKNILLYHVVSGNVTSDKVVKLKSAKTLSGKELKITVKDGKVMINDSMVTAADLNTSNGVIHVIDTVLLPQ